MSHEAMREYVRAAAALQQLPLDEARVNAVAVHLQRTAAMAALLDGLPLEPHEEPVPLYQAWPFPNSSEGNTP